MMTKSDLSPKVSAATAGAALATIIWTVVAAIWPDLLDAVAFNAVAGATATVFAFALGYAVRDPRRR